MRKLAKSNPGSRTSPAKRQPPLALAGPSSRGSGRPISRLCRAHAAERFGAEFSRRLLRELAERERPYAVDNEAVSGVADRGIDVPTVGRRAYQHRPRNCRRFAHRLFKRADGGGVGGNADSVGPALATARAGWRSLW